MRTVGVEEELLLVDPATGLPQAVAGTVLRGHTDPDTGGPGGTIESELQQQQLEVDTTPTVDLGELAAQVVDGRRRADALARAVGVRVAALATSPQPVDPETTPKARYRRMVQHFGLTTTEQLTCGCHVHVGVESEAEGVAVLDRIRVWLPVLLAVSANSPFWQGMDSGYASFRSQAWQRFPSAGPTGVFGSPAGYHRAVEAAVGSGVLLDTAMVYFDARLSHRYPTVEVRVSDVCLRAEDTVLVAALARALVETAARQATVGAAPPAVSTELLRLAGWRASRSGTSGDLLDPLTARPRPAWAVIESTLDHLEPALRENGDLEVATVTLDAIRRRGTGADTQRAAFQRDRRLAAVVEEAAALTVRRPVG